MPNHNAMLARISQFILRLLLKFERIIRSWVLSAKIDKGGGQIIFRSPFFRLKVIKHPTAILEVRGVLGCESFMGGRAVSSITLQEGSKLIIEGDFDIGDGVKISCAPGATLRIGGRYSEKGSGITASTIIHCQKNIEIGRDLICSWNVFITDSDMHQVVGSQPQADVKIDDHVWLCSDVSVLKGVSIGADSIVGCRTVVTRGQYPQAALLCGNPARVVRNEVEWKRDFEAIQ